MRISLCLLTWNEVEGCQVDIPRVPFHDFQDVFAVDGGSTDGTVDYLRSQGISVHRQDRPGYNAAYQRAFDLCTTDALVLFHPKGTIEPAQLSKFRPLLEAGHHLVIASRIIDGAVNEEDGRLLRPRKWFVMGLAVLSSLIWRRQGPRIWDVLHGMRAITMSSLSTLRTDDAGIAIDLALVIRAYRERLRVCEFPVSEDMRPSGVTHFPAFATGRRIIGFLLREILSTLLNQGRGDATARPSGSATGNPMAGRSMDRHR